MSGGVPGLTTGIPGAVIAVIAVCDGSTTRR
jgi:hypothetical protein